jgi:integrase
VTHQGHGTVFYDSHRRKWYAKIPIGKTASGNVKYRKQQAGSKREANEARKSLLAERALQRNEVVPPELFLEFANNHMRFEAFNELRATTCSGYLYVLNKYVYPEFGHRDLSSITSPEVVRYLSGLREGLSANQVNYIRATMSRIFEAAVNHRLIELNPMRRTKKMRPLPGDRTIATEPWSLEECRVALSTSLDTPMELFVHLLVLTGMRLGEILGLKWRDLDLDAHSLTIQRTLVEQRGSRTEGGVKGSPVFNPPKTARSIRTLQVSEALIRAFERHRLCQEEERLRAGDEWIDTNCVFTAPNGTPVWPSNYSARFRRFLTNNGLRHQHPHLLRHAFAHNALELGVPIESVSRALGHASLAVTLDIYAKEQRNLQNKATDEIGRYFEDNDADVTK